MSAAAPARLRPARARHSPLRPSADPSPEPFERVVELHGRALLRFCAVQAGSDRAEDVFQETMVAALRAYDQVRDVTSVRAWLFSIAARKAIDSHRARARAPQPVADPEPASAVADRVPLVEEAIWESVRELPEKQRQAVALRFVGDLSYREIGAAMRTTEAAARRNVFEALEGLRAGIDPADVGREARR